MWLEVDVRGECDIAGLWRLLGPLMYGVRAVLSEYRGVFYAEGLACPMCRSEGRWAQPTLWDIELDLDGGRKTHDFCQQANTLVELCPPPKVASGSSSAAAPATDAAAPAAVTSTAAASIISGPIALAPAAAPAAAPPSVVSTAMAPAAAPPANGGQTVPAPGSSGVKLSRGLSWGEMPKVGRKFHAFLTHGIGARA